MKKIYTWILLSLLPFAFSAKAKVEVTKLTLEGRESPLGLDVRNPRFGWQILSDHKNVMQKSYQILVASSREKLNLGESDVWNSGIVKTDCSQWIELPQSIPLLPGQSYFWKVQVSTNKGKSEWSQPAMWSTGFMSEEEWKGNWIGIDSLMPWDKEERHSRLSARYLRKTFSIQPNQVKRATIYISGLGNYALSINGQRVGNDVLTPLPTDYTKTIAYDTYDVSSYLSDNNVIGVILEGGHYFAQTQNFQSNVRTTYGQPRLLANLVIDYADGSTKIIATDTTWRITANGAIRYANEYDGELYNSNLKLNGWDMQGFDDSQWQNAQIMKSPGGKLRGSIAPNMSVYQTEKPISIHQFGKRYIVDFGTNNAGRIHIKQNTSQSGDTICIRHAELLQNGDSMLYVANLRSAEATARYVADGKAVDWTPEFTFYGFRYAEITGIDHLSASDISRELIADRMDDTNTYFALTDESEKDGKSESMLNRIVANARRGIRSNYKGMPIDCPQRDERMPWLGDRTTGCLGESYLMNQHALYSKWVGDIRDGQKENGRISDVTPSYWRLYNTNITWPAALPFSCDMLYRQYGDLRPMADSYAAIKKFLEMIRRENYKDGLVVYDRYGDWCVPPESPKLVHSKDPARKTDGQLISSTYYYYLCKMMARYGRMLGYQAESDYFSAQADTTLAAVNRTYLKDGNYSNATVTANLLPLAMNLVPKEQEAEVRKNLLTTIIDKNDTHLSAGVIGIQWLMRYLSSIGKSDVAYQLATTDTYPGWGYMVKNGATTIWELWNGNTANPSMNSGNHVMLLGDLLPWCYEYLGGIRPCYQQPGFKHIILQPDFSVSRIYSVTASHPSPYGVIRSSYTRQDGFIVWIVSIPANTTGEVYLPNGKIKKIGSGDWTFRIKG